VSIALEPLIRIPVENDQEYYLGKESSIFLDECCKWQRQVVKQFQLKPRYLKLFLENIDG